MRQPSKSTKIDAYNYKRDLSLQPLTLWGCSCRLLSCLVPSGAQGTSGNSASSWSLPRSCPSQWCIRTSRPQWRQWLDTPQQFCFNQRQNIISQFTIKSILTGWKLYFPWNAVHIISNTSTEVSLAKISKSNGFLYTFYELSMFCTCLYGFHTTRVPASPQYTHSERPGKWSPSL